MSCPARLTTLSWINVDAPSVRRNLFIWIAPFLREGSAIRVPSSQDRHTARPLRAHARSGRGGPPSSLPARWLQLACEVIDRCEVQLLADLELLEVAELGETEQVGSRRLVHH